MDPMRPRPDQRQPMTASPTVTLLCIIAISMVSGCASNHFSEMLLYKKDGTDQFQPIHTHPTSDQSLRMGNNPVYVRKNAKMTIELTHVSPGWIHQGRPKTAARPEARKVTRAESEHLRGKELWIVTKLVALSPNSPLELEGKTYYKVSNLKIGSESFAALPLDSSESLLFSHKADTAYRMVFRIYEVDAFQIKRALLKTYRDNPGLAGLVIATWDTLKATTGALAGDAALSLTKTLLGGDVGDQLLIESLLLKSNASIEMAGTLHIYTYEPSANSAEQWLQEDHLLMYDLWKSTQAWDYSFSDRDRYLQAQEKATLPIPMATISSKDSFIRLKVVQSIAPDPFPTEATIEKLDDADKVKISSIKKHQDIPAD